MTGTQAKVSMPAHLWWKIPLRIAALLAAVALVGLLMRQISGAMEKNPSPAGFSRGMLQGALMPCALPNLLVGNDVMIYAKNNTGVTYKLGYTCGVNACGAVFFGMFFWRLNRWRKGLSAGVGHGPDPSPRPKI
jgi:hypothetical protein